MTPIDKALEATIKVATTAFVGVIFLATTVTMLALPTRSSHTHSHTSPSNDQDPGSWTVDQLLLWLNQRKIEIGADQSRGRLVRLVREHIR